MKKIVKTGPDIADLINKMHDKLLVVEQKIDILISKPSPRPAEVKPSGAPYQEHRYRHDHGDRNRGNFKERVMYKATCAECNKECEVPFKPTGERPVYCKECFSRRKAVGSFSKRPDNRPREEVRAHISHVEKHHGADKKRSAPKKRVSSKRKKY